MKLISVFRRRLDGFACRVMRSGPKLYHVITEKGDHVAFKNTEVQAAEVARRTAQAGEKNFLQQFHKQR